MHKLAYSIDLREMAFPAVFLVLIRGMWRGFQAAIPRLPAC
ncbi:hypothetical protein QEO96_02395 [Kingella negevensis]|nr:hypothetical protein [Kingella negevensis]MDK4692428.1 hypothetical protein [Kingella negevensis]